MNPETLRKIFKSPFDYKTYSNEIVHRLWGCVDVYKTIDNAEHLNPTQEGDQSYFLGQMEDADGRLLGFFYTRVAGGSDVRRKRVGLRKLIQPYLKYDVDAAIAVFDDGRHWRLSYICDHRENITSAKRFSYILGDEQGQYKTPIERLGKVAEKNGRFKLSDLKDAFSVDALSKEFFDEYHRHYDIIINELKGQGFEGATIHDYVKKMMGRIVFLHFLQKKGWLNGNLAFLRDLFFFSPHQGDFLEQVLEPLFFGIFNTEKANREQLFKAKGWDMGLLEDWKELPYLNGGLFERDAVDEQNITLPASLFEDLFTFMASYNFTVDENDPDDAEVGVDPEMLGKIFESLLEDNKAKGAFYTPKEIVRYMCKESLVAYLSSCVSKSPCPAGRDLVNLINSSDSVGNDNRVSLTANGGNNLQDSQDFASETSRSIRRFVEQHEMQPELEPYRDILDTALRKVKICDPAIGSGAFPMGLLNELWRCREALAIREANDLQDLQDFVSATSRSKLKKEIIENNIYGVDIEKGAIDIARLRFWLSIVVDAKEPEPLPNFDYKFMQGNSLIESFEGFDLSRISSRLRGGQSKSMQLVLGIDSHTSRQNLQRLLREYFSVTDHKKKSSMRQAINEEVKTLIRESIGGTPASLAKLEKMNCSANQDFFLWHTWFKDIFDNGGFDIVIGNPPYIQIKWLNEKELYQQCSYKVFDSSGDIYCLFHEKANDLLKSNGIVTLITSNKWMKSNYGEKLRYYLTNNVCPIEIVDLGEGVFETATVDTDIIIWRKCLYNMDTRTVSLSNRNILSLRRTDFQSVKMPSKGLWNIGVSTMADIQKKIERNTWHITDYNVELYYGILTGANKTFILDKTTARHLIQLDEKNKRIIKPILRGKDVDRYCAKFNEVYLLCLHNGIKRKRIPPINMPKDYPSLIPYIDGFGSSFKSRGEQGDNYWNLRNCAYIDKFEAPKIIYADIVQDNGKFYLDKDGYYTNDTAFIISGENLEFLLGILNSRLFSFAYKNFYCGGTLGNKGLRFKRDYLLRVPFPKTTLSQRKKLTKLVQKALDTKRANHDANISSLEREIDQLVYQLYNLTPEEISVIEQ